MKNTQIPLLREERELLEVVSPFPTPQTAIKYLLEKGVIDHKMLRVFITRRHYYSLVEQGYRKMDALGMTAERYCISEDTLKDYIYKHKDT